MKYTDENMLGRPDRAIRIKSIINIQAPSDNRIVDPEGPRSVLSLDANPAQHISQSGRGDNFRWGTYSIISF